jgi:preprotein translocase subunit YajC
VAADGPLNKPLLAAGLPGSTGVRRIQSPIFRPLAAAPACPHAAGQSPNLWSAPVFISSAFAQTAPAAAGGGDLMSSMASMLPLLLMFVVLYFVMIRPQMKKQKEHRAMIEALAKGDEVVTAGGLLGRVSKIGDGFIGVELAEGVEVQMQRASVVQVMPKGTMK